jgi:hypothetical protein
MEAYKMSADKLMLELIVHLAKLSDAEIITEYGIEYLQFMVDAKINIKKIRSARIYIPIGDSYIGMN